MKAPKTALLPGTLDLLILRAVSHGEHHGYGILLRVQQMTDGALMVEQGALYPALARLEGQRLLESTWGTSDNNRRAKFYRLTAGGRRRLKTETRVWHRLVDIMSLALGRTPPAVAAATAGSTKYKVRSTKYRGRTASGS